MKPIGSALVCGMLAGVACLAGCKSDLNQQLLERELRYQEDQIYSLQDELESASLKLQRAAGENASLKRQLGVADGDSLAPRTAPARARPGGLPAPVNVPPAIQVPDGGSVPLAPPELEGIPPLPKQGADAAPPAAPPATANDEPPLFLSPPPEGQPTAPSAAAPSAVRRLAHETPLGGEGPPARLVVNLAQTACVDSDADGASEGLAVVFEPRDAEERLVAATGDVAILVFDAAAGTDPATGEGAPIARWDVPAAEAATRFRRTSRARGMQFSFPWPGRPPAGDHVRVVVRVVPPGGQPLEADATIAVR